MSQQRILISWRRQVQPDVMSKQSLFKSQSSVCRLIGNNGLRSQTMCPGDHAKAALSKLNKSAGDYYKSGANEEVTLRDNLSAFRNYKLRPRFLHRDVSKRDMATTFLGSKVSMPIGVAPTAMQRMAHPDGELANVRACESANVIMILSTISTTSLEDVAKEAPSATKWFQLYIYKDREVTRRLVQRAEQSGFKALVLTVDTPIFGTRWADSRNKFCLPPHLKLGNLEAEKSLQMESPTSSSASGLNEYAASLFDSSLTWKDVDWLSTITKLPIVVKGILTPEDALVALEHNVSAIIVSNHGARQLDHVQATIDALPAVASVVRGRCELYVDGGFRTGTDVLKALALGARGVFVGRPVVWGLTNYGEKGVKDVLEIFRRELDVAMALSGCAKLEDITPNLVVKKEFYSHM